MQNNPQVDHYIIESAAFARPILNHLRTLIQIVDERIEEKIKWRMPFFELKGPICYIAGFKNHCAMGFWKGSLMHDDCGIFSNKTNAMGVLGKIKSLKDLPNDEVLIAYLQQAIKLNEDGVKLPSKAERSAKTEVIIPTYFLDALKNDPVAMAVFQQFSPSKRKDYVYWLEEAKTETTRIKRLETAIEWIAEGKSRMWKYEK